MKNKIEFSENDTIQKRQIINLQENRLRFEQNTHSITAQNQGIKAFKIIKGKVKIQDSNSDQKFAKNDWLDDEEELVIVWKRMLLFLKFAFMFLLVFSLFVLFQKNLLGR